MDKSAQIKEQIEFYFSDNNYPRDKHLQNVVKENDGWVPIQHLTTFKRLAKLSTDVKEIAEALKGSDLVEVDSENTKVKRAVSLSDPTELAIRAMGYSVYVKGFPTDMSLDDLQNEFKPYNVKAIRQRRNGKEFKGSVFLEFANDEEAKNYVANPKQTYKETPLVTMMKQDYVDMKKKEREEKGEPEKESKKSKDKKAVQTEERSEDEYPRDCIVHFENVGESTTRDSLKVTYFYFLFLLFFLFFLFPFLQFNSIQFIFPLIFFKKNLGNLWRVWTNQFC